MGKKRRKPKRKPSAVEQATKQRRREDRRLKQTENRKKHPKKDYEKLLREVEGHGWRVWADSDGHFHGLCPCGDHQVNGIPGTPSKQGSLTRVRAKFRRASCTKGKF